METTKDPFYELYKDAGLVPVEIVTNGIMTLLCVVGIFLNASLVYVISKTKSLHSPCNILIGLYAFFGSFLLIGSSIKFFVFLLGFNYISLRLCFYLQIVFLIGGTISIHLQLCVGIDRLFGVLFPFWYKSHVEFLLFKCFIICCIIKSPLIVLSTFYGSSKHWEKPVMCTFGEPSRQPETQTFEDVQFIAIYCTEICCYTLLWLVSWCRKSQISQNQKRLMLSLTVIVSISFVCLVGVGFVVYNATRELKYSRKARPRISSNSVFYNFIMPQLNLNVCTIEYAISPIGNSFFHLSYCSSAPVLFFCSEMYRRAFRKHFGSTQHAQIVVQFVQSAKVQTAN